MTHDDIVATLRALGVRRIPDPLPPFRPRCDCGQHRGTRLELPARHDWHQAHGGHGCDVAPPAVLGVGGVAGLHCACGKAFGMNAAALMAHTKDDHGREATTSERTPRT